MLSYPAGIDRQLNVTIQNQDEASVLARSRRERGGAEDETGSIASSEFRFVHLIRGCLQADMAALCRRIFPGGLPQRYHMPKDTTLKTSLKRFRLGPLSYLAFHSANRRVDLLLTADLLSACRYELRKQYAFRSLASDFLMASVGPLGPAGEFPSQARPSRSSPEIQDETRWMT